MMDTSPDIKKLPRKLRRASQCGKYFHAIRYNSGQNRLKAFCYAWLAVLTYPEILRTRPMASVLMPGYWGLRCVLGQLKRIVFR
jgi:hypothetical protein